MTAAQPLVAGPPVGRPDRPDLLDGLVDLASELSEADREAVRSFVDRLLAAPPEGIPRRCGHSGLNRDGSPLELCLSALSSVCLSRFVADPASTEDDPLARCAAGLAALEAAYDPTRSRRLRPLCAATLETIVGPLVGPLADQAVAELGRYVEGLLWLGAGPGLPGLALYVDATKLDPVERWRRAAAWLGALLAQGAEAEAVVARLAPAGELMAVGVEGTEPADARAKLFWRLRQPIALAELGVPRFLDPALFDFLGLLLDADRPLPLSGLVLSASFRVASGELFDAKLDLCGHCLAYAPAEWEARLARATTAFGLVPLPVGRALAGGRAEVAFVGLNRNPMGSRLDLFLKPASWYDD